MCVANKRDKYHVTTGAAQVHVIPVNKAPGGTNMDLVMVAKAAVHTTIRKLHVSFVAQPARYADASIEETPLLDVETEPLARSSVR